MFWAGQMTVRCEHTSRSELLCLTPPAPLTQHHTHRSQAPPSRLSCTSRVVIRMCRKRGSLAILLTFLTNPYDQDVRKFAALRDRNAFSPSHFLVFS